jgi:hypothetical protein
MRKTQNIKIIKRRRAETEAAAETNPPTNDSPVNDERGFAAAVKNWVREYRMRKQRAEQAARRLLDGFAPVTDEI